MAKRRHFDEVDLCEICGLSAHKGPCDEKRIARIEAGRKYHEETQERRHLYGTRLEDGFQMLEDDDFTTEPEEEQ